MRSKGALGKTAVRAARREELRRTHTAAARAAIEFAAVAGVRPRPGHLYEVPFALRSLAASTGSELVIVARDVAEWVNEHQRVRTTPRALALAARLRAAVETAEPGPLREAALVLSRAFDQYTRADQQQETPHEHGR